MPSMLSFKIPINVYTVTIFMQQKKTAVISIRLLPAEHRKLESLSKKTGVSPSSIARGLMRRGLERQSDKELISLIKLGSIMKPRK